MTEVTDYDDTHPCLTERLEMYDYKPHDCLSESLNISAAEHFLGGQESSIIQQLDEQFLDQDLWESMNQELSREFNYFDKMSRTQQYLTPEQAARCSNVIAVKDIDRAIEILSCTKANYPDSSTLTCLLGELLLRQQDERGAEYIGIALLQKPGSILFSNLADVYDNLYQMNFDTQADLFLNEYRKLHDVLTAYEAQLLRSKDVGSSFLPHDLPDYEVQQISSFLKNYSEIHQAFLVKLRVSSLPDAPLFLLGIQFKRSAKASQQKVILEEVDSLICLGVVGVLSLVGKQRKRFRKIDGSCIFRAS